MTTLQPSSSFINPWTRKPLVSGGNFHFSGQLRITLAAARVLEYSEMVHVLDDLRQSVKQQNGLHHLQVYTHLDGAQVWIADNEQQDPSDYTGGFSEDNYFTIMIPEEY